MKRDIGKEILTGLEEIAAWKRGEKKLRTVEVAMPKAADVKSIRNSLELSQESFAGFLGVSLSTVRNSELVIRRGEVELDSVDRESERHCDLRVREASGNHVEHFRLAR